MRCLRKPETLELPWSFPFCLYSFPPPHHNPSGTPNNSSSKISVIDPMIIILSEVRERQIPYDMSSMWNLKKKK